MLKLNVIKIKNQIPNSQYIPPSFKFFKGKCVYAMFHKTSYGYNLMIFNEKGQPVKSWINYEAKLPYRSSKIKSEDFEKLLEIHKPNKIFFNNCDLIKNYLTKNNTPTEYCEDESLIRKIIKMS